MKQRILSRIAAHIHIDSVKDLAFISLGKCAAIDPAGASLALSKTACVIAAGTWAESRCLIKNRDRNYHPRLVVFHEEIDGMEVCYLKDLETGWVEGMNAQGMGIVNSALMVGRDEAEKKRAKKGEPTKDGQQMLTALAMDDPRKASAYLCTKKTRMLGHTIIGTPKTLRTIEQTSKHSFIEKESIKDTVLVRTNHGWNHEDAGYQKGEDHTSTLVRRENAQRVLEDVAAVRDLAPALRKHRYRNPAFNIVRDAKMETSSQMVLNLSDKAMLLYLLPGKQEFLGVVNTLGRKPKIVLEVFTYDKGGKVKEVKYAEINESDVPDDVVE